MSTRPHPAVAAGLAVVGTAEGLLVEGGASRQLFTGAAARDLLPRLLPLLDGHTSLAEAAETLSLPLPQVAQAVAVLGRGRLLHQGPGGSADAAGAFLSRAAAAATPAASPAEIGRRLAEATVVVAATGPVGGLLAADLTLSGIGKVSTTLTAAAAVTVATDDRLAEAVAATAPVLRLGFAGDAIELGPFFAGAETVCPQCFLPGGPPSAGLPDEAAAQLLCSLATAAVIGWVSGLGSPSLGRKMQRIDVLTFERELLEVTPSAGCQTCTLTGDGPLGRLEWLNRRASRQGAWPPKPPAAPDLDLASSPRIPLESVPSPWRTVLAAAQARPYADTYLLAAQGLPHPVYRWSPSGQALIASRGDLTTCPPIAGLPPGAQGVLVFVAATARLTPAYAEQSLRRAFLAAGRAVAAVSTAQTEYQAVTARAIDAGLADLLELHHGGEHLAAVVGLYRRLP